MASESILVVDDRQDIVHFLEHSTLSPLGFQVMSAYNGERGLQAAIQHNPDLIMLDMSMPRMDGMEMLKALRQTPCQAPVIFMTMYGSEKIAVEAFRLGVRDYLEKPFTVDEAQQAVNRALRETRLSREKEELARDLLAADTVRQTVVTLAHYINNNLLVVSGGLQLVLEALLQERYTDPMLPKVVGDCLISADRIGTVLRVLQRYNEVKLSDYSGGVKMLDIEDALQRELKSA